MKNIARMSAFLVASMLAITPVVYSQPESVLKAPASDYKQFPVKLTGKETFQSLVRAGKYDSVDEELLDINFNMTTLRKTETNLTLVTFFEDFPIEELPARLAKAHLRPATMFEFLAFGAQYQKEQLLEGRPILSPDATLEIVDVYDDEKPLRQYNVYLRGVAGKRILGANYAGMFWNKNWRCLAAELPETETKKGR